MNPALVLLLPPGRSPTSQPAALCCDDGWEVEHVRLCPGSVVGSAFCCTVPLPPAPRCPLCPLRTETTTLSPPGYRTPGCRPPGSHPSLPAGRRAHHGRLDQGPYCCAQHRAGARSLAHLAPNIFVRTSNHHQEEAPTSSAVAEAARCPTCHREQPTSLRCAHLDPPVVQPARTRTARSTQEVARTPPAPACSKQAAPKPAAASTLAGWELAQEQLQRINRLDSHQRVQHITPLAGLGQDDN